MTFAELQNGDYFRFPQSKSMWVKSGNKAKLLLSYGGQKFLPFRTLTTKDVAGFATVKKVKVEVTDI